MIWSCGGMNIPCHLHVSHHAFDWSQRMEFSRNVLTLILLFDFEEANADLTLSGAFRHLATVHPFFEVHCSHTRAYLV